MDSEDNNRKKMMEKLQNDLKEAQDEEDDYKRQLRDADKTINALKLGIKSVYERMGVDHDQLKELLGSQGVTESNMMQYLGVIEQKTNELIETFHFSKTGKPISNLINMLFVYIKIYLMFLNRKTIGT